MVGSGRWTSTSRPSTRCSATRSATSCSTEVAPVVDEHERERRFPIEIVRRIGELGWLGHPDPRGRGRRRARHAGLRDRDRGDRPGLGLARADRRRPHEPRLRAAPPGRLARAEAALPRADGPRRGHRRVRPDRAGRRQRFGRHADDRPARGRTRRRLVGHRRRQALHHQRRPGGTYIVTARTGDDATTATPRSARSSCPADTPGFSVGRLEDKLGPARLGDRRAAASTARASRRRTCSASRASGFKTFLKILDGGRISIGALAVGLAQARARRRRSRTPRRASSSAGRSARSRASRSWSPTWRPRSRRPAALVWRAAWLKDQGRDYGLAAAQAKLFASEVSSRATNAAIQIHGGYGYVDGLSGRALPARREADRDRRGDEPGPAARDRPEDPRAARRLILVTYAHGAYSARSTRSLAGGRPRFGSNPRHVRVPSVGDANPGCTRGPDGAYHAPHA